MSEDTTIIRQVEIVRFHGECEEVLMIVPVAEIHAAFSSVIKSARKRDISGRFTYRNVA